MKIALFGLGEAGTLIGKDLVAAGIVTSAFDPASVPTPVGITRHDHPASAVRDVDAVFALTAGVDSMTAMQQALHEIPASALYADFSTNSAGAKRSLAAVAAGRGLPFVDIALMGIVPGNGMRTPALASGPGALRFVEVFTPLGMRIEAVSEVAGDAATRKLLRSVMMKGLAATVMEAMRGADNAGCAEWLWQNLTDEVCKADATFLPRLMRGTQLHAVRRLHEMEAALALLEELVVTPVMTRATVANLRTVIRDGMPAIPTPPD